MERLCGSHPVTIFTETTAMLDARSEPVYLQQHRSDKMFSFVKFTSSSSTRQFETILSKCELHPSVFSAHTHMSPACVHTHSSHT